MSSLYDALRNTTTFRKIEIDGLLLVQYTCDPGGPRTKIWSQTNYFTYVLSGKMTLKTPDRDFEIEAGQSYFVKKGAFTIPQFFGEVFCDLIIFMPDEFIRSVVEKYQLGLLMVEEDQPLEAVHSLELDQTLSLYYQSLVSYFQSDFATSKILLKLKLEELVVNVLSNPHHSALAAYFTSIYENHCPSLVEIMESNFNSNLTIAEFARLAARSLSSFRRDFQQVYDTTPSRWLKEKRLQLCRHLIKTTEENIEGIAYQGGFVSRTHFIKCFRDRFGVTPSEFRKRQKAS